MIRFLAVSTLTLLLSAAAAAQTPAAAPAATPAAQSAAPPPAAAPVAQSAPAAGAAGPAGDPAKGRELTRMCEGCHGIEGWRTAYPEVYHVPKLGGQHAAYIVQALHEYRNGDRSHPSMQAIAGSLSDQDMANLAAYYSQAGVHTNTASK